MSDGLTWSSPAPDFKSDAAALLEKHAAAVTEEEKESVLKILPDPKLNMDTSGYALF